MGEGKKVSLGDLVPFFEDERESIPEGEPVPQPVPNFHYKREEVLEQRRLGRPHTREEAIDQFLIKQTKKIAVEGVKYYNEKNVLEEGVHYHYEVDYDYNFLTSITLFDNDARQAYLHANFRAKKVDDISREIHPSELFFAELTYKRKERGFIVLSCCIIESAETRDLPLLSDHCWYCPSNLSPVILHPIGCYQHGVTTD